MSMLDYKSTIKVVGFDLDQTLYPKSPEIDRAIQSYIFQKIADYKKCRLEDAEKIFSDLYQDGHGLSGRRALIVIGVPEAEKVIQGALEEADIASFLMPDPEVSSLLKKLKKNYQNLDIITGSSRKNAYSKLNSLAIDRQIFSHILTGDIFQKSDGWAFKKWLSLYGHFEPSQFLYIGDRVNSDYLIPSRLGIKSVLVNISEKDNTIDCPQFGKLKDIEEILR